MLLLKKLPNITKALLLSISAIVGVLFFTGSSSNITIKNAVYSEPVYTDLIIIWTYILVALAITITLSFLIYKFIKSAIENPKKALIPIGIIIGSGVLLVIAYALGDGTPLNITGYDGNENVEFWLKTTDMLLYTCYFLISLSGLLIIFSGISKFFK